ncbi:MAG TPA: ABC transporter ATP-binding protein [Edaphocola sp.]|nr:ABC transporter ATP-binding protein [Edaphocola sp.]
MNTKQANTIILKAEKLYKNYGQLTVLNNVSISIRPGEFVAVTGHSGAGKSTLLHILGGLDKPDQGSVRFLDEDILMLSAKKQLRFRNDHIGFVFQFHHLLPEFTAVENVSMPLWIKGVHKNEAERQALAVLERVGLPHRASHKPGALSGGEQQRVAIARALINRPDIIFADEPTGNLDSENARVIHQLFLELQKEFRLTFVVVTHNEELASLAERELKMKDGMFVPEN